MHCLSLHSEEVQKDFFRRALHSQVDAQYLCVGDAAKQVLICDVPGVGELRNDG